MTTGQRPRNSPVLTCVATTAAAPLIYSLRHLHQVEASITALRIQNRHAVGMLQALREQSGFKRNLVRRVRAWLGAEGAPPLDQCQRQSITDQIGLIETQMQIRERTIQAHLTTQSALLTLQAQAARRNTPLYQTEQRWPIASGSTIDIECSATPADGRTQYAV